MLNLWLFGIRQLGWKTTLVMVIKWLGWWLTTGRKYQQNWRLGRVLFDFVGHERVVKFDGKCVIFSLVPPVPSPAFDNMMLPRKPRKAENNRVVLYPCFADVALTGRCQFNCWHCSAAGRVNSDDDLPLDAWRRIVSQLQEASVYYIGFTGGEPLLRDDLEDILASADERSVLALATSGLGLTAERAKRLKEAGLFYMLVSLDHPRPQVHDSHRRFDGAYAAAVQAMRYARAANIYTILQAAITKEFVAEKAIQPLAELGKDIGIQEIRCRGIVPAGRLAKINRAALLTEQDANTFVQIAEQINRQPDYPKISLFEEFERPSRGGCNAGSSLVYVDSRGNVCPCDFVPLSFGNLCEESFEDVWSRMRASLGMPQKDCLARYVADHVAEQYGKLPLPPKVSREICRRYRTPELPGMY